MVACVVFRVCGVRGWALGLRTKMEKGGREETTTEADVGTGEDT